MAKEKIIKNAVKCKICGDVIESVHTHDYKTCSCGAVSVDGGKDYLKRSFPGGNWKEWFEDLSEFEEEK